MLHFSPSCVHLISAYIIMKFVHKFIHAYFYTLFGLLPPRQSVHLQHPLGSHVLSSVIKYIELKHVRNS